MSGRPSNADAARAAELLTRLDRARLYLDAGAPRDAHACLVSLLEAPTEIGSAAVPGRLDLARGDLVHSNPALLFRAWITLAESCRVLGHADHLERISLVLESARDRAEELDGSLTQEDRLGVLYELARHRLHAGAYEPALDLLREVPESVLERVEPRRAVGWLGLEAQCLARCGAFEEAEALIVRSMRWSELSGDPALRGDVRSRMASVLRLRGRLQEAIELYRNRLKNGVPRLGRPWLTSCGPGPTAADRPRSALSTTVA